MTPGVGTAVGGLEPFEELTFELHTAGEAFLAGILNDTVCIIVGEGCVVVALVARSGNGESVVLVEGRAGDGIDPVGTRSGERIRIDGLGKRGIPAGLVRVVGIGTEGGQVIAVHRELGCIHYVELARKLGESHVGLEAYVGLALVSGTGLRSDYDDAVGAP